MKHPVALVPTRQKVSGTRRNGGSACISVNQFVGTSLFIGEDYDTVPVVAFVRLYGRSVIAYGVAVG